jgi:hypothetical protein
MTALNTKAEGIAEAEANEVRARSVVAPSYKTKYKEKAVSKGRRDKAAYRSCDDWLAREFAKVVLTTDKKRQLIVPELEALLDANGVKHAHWNRTTPGWQGRLRMTGGLALRRIVADVGFLVLADGTQVEAPRAWCLRNGG